MFRIPQKGNNKLVEAKAKVSFSHSSSSASHPGGPQHNVIETTPTGVTTFAEAMDKVRKNYSGAWERLAKR